MARDTASKAGANLLFGFSTDLCHAKSDIHADASKMA
jgi:hypothetical protein